MFFIQSIHEGEPIFVFFWLLSVQFFLKSDIVLFGIILLEGRFDENSAGHHTGDTLPQCVDFKIMDCSVEWVDLFGVKFVKDLCEFFVDMIFENVVFKFGWFWDVVVHSLEDFNDEFEGLLIDGGDGDLNRYKSLLCVLFQVLRLPGCISWHPLVVRSGYILFHLR